MTFLEIIVHCGKVGLVFLSASLNVMVAQILRIEAIALFFGVVLDNFDAEICTHNSEKSLILNHSSVSIFSLYKFEIISTQVYF